MGPQDAGDPTRRRTGTADGRDRVEEELEVAFEPAVALRLKNAEEPRVREQLDALGRNRALAFKTLGHVTQDGERIVHRSQDVVGDDHRVFNAMPPDALTLPGDGL